MKCGPAAQVRGCGRTVYLDVRDDKRENGRARVRKWSCLSLDVLDGGDAREGLSGADAIVARFVGGAHGESCTGDLKDKKWWARSAGG